MEINGVLGLYKQERNIPMAYSLFNNLHCVREKVTPCVLFYNSGTGCRILTKFLRQQCSIEFQTKRKISVKSVDNCKSYSGFSAGTQKMKCPL